MNWSANWLKSLAEGIAMLFPACKRVIRLESQAFKRGRPFLQRLGPRLHLIRCGWCRRYRKQVRFLRKMAREHPDGPVDPDSQKPSRAMRERIKRRLNL